MTKRDRIIRNIQSNVEISKAIAREPFDWCDVDVFYDHAMRYIKATKERRLFAIVDSVSRSGMSRNLKFMEMHRNSKTKPATYYLRNFSLLFNLMGFSSTGKHTDTFRVYGCGMDMIFDTHYQIINKLAKLGFITKAQCHEYEQMRPHSV